MSAKSAQAHFGKGFTLFWEQNTNQGQEKEERCENAS